MWKKWSVHQFSNLFLPWAVLGSSWSSPVVTTSAGATPTRRRRRLVDSHDEILVRIHTSIKFTNWMRNTRETSLHKSRCIFYLLIRWLRFVFPGPGTDVSSPGWALFRLPHRDFRILSLRNGFFAKLFGTLFLLTDCNTGWPKITLVLQVNASIWSHRVALSSQLIKNSS